MIALAHHSRVYLALGSTDMRKEINGLSILVEGVLELDPFSGHLFAFCNNKEIDRKDPLLAEERVLSFSKETGEGAVPLAGNARAGDGLRELSFLLEGLDFRALRPHRELHYSTLF